LIIPGRLKTSTLMQFAAGLTLAAGLLAGCVREAPVEAETTPAEYAPDVMDEETYGNGLRVEQDAPEPVSPELYDPRYESLGLEQSYEDGRLVVSMRPIPNPPEPQEFANRSEAPPRPARSYVPASEPSSPARVTPAPRVRTERSTPRVSPAPTPRLETPRARVSPNASTRAQAAPDPRPVPAPTPSPAPIAASRPATVAEDTAATGDTRTVAAAEPTVPVSPATRAARSSDPSNAMWWALAGLMLLGLVALLAGGGRPRRRRRAAAADGPANNHA
jgi:hypothetical protein